MNKKVEKILNILVIAMVLISIATNVFALTPGDIKPTDVDSDAEASITNISNQVVGVMQTIGIVVSVIVLMVLGIRYMMGSASEKSEYKKTFIPYVVGAACLFAASVFAQAIFDFFSHMSA